MGRRRGRTGAGGAVVSSLSENSGGTVRSKSDGRNQSQSASGNRRNNNEDKELLALASGNNPDNSSTGASSSSSTQSSSKWLGKSPTQMLREWCNKNNRKRPFFKDMAGGEGIMRCIIPQGRKDGSGGKGKAFETIIGVGAKPGQEYAALNVLHQVEKGKPLERLLAPEFRPVWLDLDKIVVEVEKEDQRRAQNKERREKNAAKRAKAEKMRESATINISSASRQVIEDALLEQTTSTSKNTRPIFGGNSSTAHRNNSESSLRQELLKMGFSEFDAVNASQTFSNVTEAIDYLCLNLDESELPPSLAPTSDIEVVQFYSKDSKQGPGRIKETTRDLLTDLTCLSRQAAEKSLRLADGEIDNALTRLYNILTHNCLEQDITTFPDSLMEQVKDEKETEEELIKAVYGEDAKLGVGSFAGFDTKWAAVIRIEEGFPGVDHYNPVHVAVIDIDGFYPFSAPLVLIASNFSDFRVSANSLNTSQRRALMRASAYEVLSLRKSQGVNETDTENHTPVPVIHGVLSFLSDASPEKLISHTPKRFMMATQRNVAENIKSQVAAKGESSLPPKKIKRNMTRKQIQRPLPVARLKSSPELSKMLERRKKLPAHTAKQNILKSIRASQVVVVSGATGSGKTTQVPQFILEEAAETQEPVSIVCTQPRRIAAISVAERVAAERNQKIGESVGYQVKLNTKRSDRTRLTFCTTGVLLRRLQGDPSLESLTHVVVDEVHERSVETDFLLLLLREIVRMRPNLRIILMSATLDANKFSEYFSMGSGSGSKNAVPVISIPGRTFPVDHFYLNTVVSMTRYRLKPGDRYAKRVGKGAHKGKYGQEPPKDADWPKTKNSATLAAQTDDPIMDQWDDDDEEEIEEGTKDVDYISSDLISSTLPPESEQDRIDNRSTVSLIDESVVNVDIIDLLVKRIDANSRKANQRGAILIFLPGTAEIAAVIRKLSTGPGSNYLWSLPLHSLLSSEDQARVFQEAPRGKRKVICATNIAETSITVEDVTVVIDTLRAKETGYDPLNGSSTLEERFISKAAAKQRAGRAGRVSHGTCYRLVREHTFENKIPAQQIPEIRRVALEHLVLNILSIIPDNQSRNDPHAFLAKAVDPPDPQAVTRAIQNLIDIGALKRENVDASSSKVVVMTALGKHLSGLPVDAKIGKLLVFGAVFNCMDPILTIAATISERSPFYAPFEKRDEARAARTVFEWSKSDLLTYVKAFDKWREIRENREGYKMEMEFCDRHFLSRKTLLAISDGRNQLADAVADAGFSGVLKSKGSRGWEREEEYNTFSLNPKVLKAITCAALYPNIARIDLPDTKYREVAGGTVATKYNAKDLKLRAKNGQRLFIHPESINFHQGNYNSRWIAFFSKVETSKLFIRDTTEVSPYAILLFGGEIDVNHHKGQMTVDSWVVFQSKARVAVLARELRRELDSLLLRKFEDASLNLSQEGKTLNDAIIRLITLES